MSRELDLEHETIIQLVQNGQERSVAAEPGEHSEPTRGDVCLTLT